MSYYKCDKMFHIDQLKKLYETHDNSAIVLVSGKCALFYLYNKNKTELLSKIKTDLPNQHKTGGQSAQRFERIRSEKIKLFATQIIDLMIKFYVTNGIFNCTSLKLAGPYGIKEIIWTDSVFKKYFSHQCQVITTDEIDFNTVKKVVADIILNENDYCSVVKNLIDSPDTVDLVVFGIDRVTELFIAGQLKNLYLYENYTDKNFFIERTEESKTKIIMVTSKQFNDNYGPLVGVTYYNQVYDHDYD